jgi:hypothetical protein
VGNGDGDPAALAVVCGVADAAVAPGSRVTAVYVLGSLAHGSFASLVSDIDVAPVLADAGPTTGLRSSSSRRPSALAGFPWPSGCRCSGAPQRLQCVTSDRRGRNRMRTILIFV